MRTIVYRITPEEAGWCLQSLGRPRRWFGSRAEAFKAASLAARRERKMGGFAWISVEAQQEQQEFAGYYRKSA